MKCLSSRCWAAANWRNTKVYFLDVGSYSNPFISLYRFGSDIFLYFLVQFKFRLLR